MAVEKFESDRESLVHGATRVRGTRTEVIGDLAKLRNVIDDLVAHGWHGTAPAEFTQVMSAWDRNANRLTDAMEEIAKLLNDSGAQFSMTDEQQKTMLLQTKDYSGALGQRLS
jgi:WXG100 family type VII secretion target